MVRVPDSWLKDRGFESPQERQENFLLQGLLSVLTLISVSIPAPWHIKDPGHSAKSAGGRLQLSTHTPYVCGFAWCSMVVWCTQNLHRDSCGFMWHQPCQRCKYTTSVDIQKNALRKASHSWRITCECSESAQERRIVLYKWSSINQSKRRQSCSSQAVRGYRK